MIIRLAWNKRQRELATVALVPWKTRPLRGRPENSLREFSRLRAPLTGRQQNEHLFHARGKPLALPG